MRADVARFLKPLFPAVLVVAVCCTPIAPGPADAAERTAPGEDGLPETGTGARAEAEGARTVAGKHAENGARAEVDVAQTVGDGHAGTGARAKAEDARTAAGGHAEYGARAEVDVAQTVGDGHAGSGGATPAESLGRDGLTPDVLILYHSPEPPPGAAIMESLLTHFRVTARTAHASALDDGAANDADFIIHFGADPEAAAALARARNVPHMAFLPVPDDGTPAGILIRYRNAEYPAAAVSAARIGIGTGAETIARLSDGRDERPLIARDGNLWLVGADLTHELIRWLVADVLHDFLGEWHPEGAYGLIVIENVSPLTDPDHLRRLADLLGGHRIPFAVAVEPVRRSQAPSERASIAGSPDLADALRYMAEAGGTLVLDGSRIDPEDPEESARRTARDIAALQEIGGHPAALYAADGMAESLAAADERVFFSNVIAYSAFRTDGTRHSGVPYALLRGAGGRAFPESVGAAGGDAAVSSLLARAGALRIVRDALIGVGLDASQPYETAAGLVGQIAREPLYWTDLRYIAWRVETGFLRLSGRGDGTMDAVITDRGRLEELRKRERQTIRFESVTYYSSWTLVLVVAAFIALFMLFIVIAQMRRNRRLFMERELE